MEECDKRYFSILQIRKNTFCTDSFFSQINTLINCLILKGIVYIFNFDSECSFGIKHPGHLLHPLLTKNVYLWQIFEQYSNKEMEDRIAQPILSTNVDYIYPYFTCQLTKKGSRVL